MKNNKFVLVSPVYLANSILKIAKEKNIKINSAKLYNLIYLVYSDYLYHTQTKLFNEQFSPSFKGPILPSVYFKFNCYGDEEIKDFASDAKGQIFIVNNDILNSIINLNLDLYGYSYKEELIEITNKRFTIRQKFNNNINSTIENQKLYTLKLQNIK